MSVNAQDIYNFIQSEYGSSFENNFGLGLGLSINDILKIIETYRELIKNNQITPGYIGSDLVSNSELKNSAEIIAEKTGFTVHQCLVWVNLLEHDIQVENYDLYSYVIGAELPKNIGEDIIDGINTGTFSLFKNFPFIPIALGIGIITLIIYKRK